MKKSPTGTASIVRRSSPTKPSPISAEIAAALIPQGKQVALPAKLPTGTQSSPARTPEKDTPEQALAYAEIEVDAADGEPPVAESSLTEVVVSEKAELSESPVAPEDKEAPASEIPASEIPASEVQARESRSSKDWNKMHLLIAFVALNALGLVVMRLLGV